MSSRNRGPAHGKDGSLDGRAHKAYSVRMHGSDRMTTFTQGLARMAMVALTTAFLGCQDGTKTPDAKIDYALNDCTWPSCITDLFATCVPSGDCEATFDRSTGTLTTCSGNGVTERHTATTSTDTEACKKNGVLSYSLERRYRRTGDSMSYSFTLKNGEGTTVVEGQASDAGVVLTCIGGPTYSLPATCEPYAKDTVDGGSSTLCSETGSCQW